VAIDVCERNDIMPVALEGVNTERLKDFLLEETNFYNPIDVSGNTMADRYKKTIELMPGDKNLKAVVMFILKVSQMAAGFPEIVEKGIKPLLENKKGECSLADDAMTWTGG